MKYDVFISFKATDEFDNMTQDYQIAKNLYNQLTSKGLSVFFAPATLGQIGSSYFKDDIDKALDESTTMVVVLDNLENSFARWVKYEWESFYGDYLSLGKREHPNVFTYISNNDMSKIHRTLRNVQHFMISDGVEPLYQHLKPLLAPSERRDEENVSERFSIISGKNVTRRDIEQAIELDKMVYNDLYYVTVETCLEWMATNPDIYVMIRDNEEDKIVGYVNVSPVTDECYEKIKSGDFVDTGITTEMILSYDMPYPYNIYFSSVVVHPNYQNSGVFMRLFNALVDKIIALGKQEVYFKRMIADAVSENGVKFCNLFGMQKVQSTHHDSTLYEVKMVPPQFRIMSKKTKDLFDFCKNVYEELPFLFDE